MNGDGFGYDSQIQLGEIKEINEKGLGDTRFSAENLIRKDQIK